MTRDVVIWVELFFLVFTRSWFGPRINLHYRSRALSLLFYSKLKLPSLWQFLNSLTPKEVHLSTMSIYPHLRKQKNKPKKKKKTTLRLSTKFLNWNGMHAYARLWNRLIRKKTGKLFNPRIEEHAFVNYALFFRVIGLKKRKIYQPTSDHFFTVLCRDPWKTRPVSTFQTYYKQKSLVLWPPGWTVRSTRNSTRTSPRIPVWISM